MEKNEVLNALISGLISQRATLVEQLTALNPSDTGFTDKKIAIENAIYNIDNQINNRALDLLITKMKKQKQIEVPEGFEIDMDKSQIFFKEITEVKSWEELENIEGYFIDTNSYIRRIDEAPTSKQNKHLFPTKEDAKSSLALSQLLQLRNRVVGDWIPDWKKDSSKYVILRVDGEIEYIHASTCFNFLSFKTKQQAETFIKKHQELLKTYFQIK